MLRNGQNLCLLVAVMFNLKKGNVTFLFPNKMISTNKWCVAKSKK